MKNGFLVFVFTLCLGSLSAPAASLDNAHTHHTAIAVPELSGSSASFKLARTWFLPDWQAGLASRTDTAPPVPATARI